MKNFKNNVEIRGYVYDFDKRLDVRQDRNGKMYIAGRVSIATDPDAYNIVPVEFFAYATYVDKKTGQEKPTATFEFLNALIAGDKRVYVKAGKDATCVRISANADVNDFVGRDGSMVSANRIRGSFIHEIPAQDIIDGKGCATFEIETLITSATEREVEDGDNFMVVKGYAFNYRKDFLPLTMYVRNPNGIAWVNDQDVSTKNPLLINLSGSINTNTVVRKTQVESAWGEAKEVTTTGKPFQTWDITWMSNMIMDYGDESTITAEEVKNGLVAREQSLAAIKARSTGAAYAAAPAAKPKPKADDFTFDDEELPF